MRTLRWLLVVAGMIGTVLIGAAIDRGSHSVSDMLYGAAIPLLVLWLVIGIVLLLLRPGRA